MSEYGLRDVLRMLDPKARDKLRRVLIRDDADRNENGKGWADIIDLLTMYPDARRRVARVLGEIDAQ
jgi:hypothetical protein